jgi:hypothetical protein
MNLRPNLAGCETETMTRAAFEALPLVFPNQEIPSGLIGLRVRSNLARKEAGDLVVWDETDPIWIVATVEATGRIGRWTIRRVVFEVEAPPPVAPEPEPDLDAFEAFAATLPMALVLRHLLKEGPGAYAELFVSATNEPNAKGMVMRVSLRPHSLDGQGEIRAVGCRCASLSVEARPCLFCTTHHVRIHYGDSDA